MNPGLEAAFVAGCKHSCSAFSFVLPSEWLDVGLTEASCERCLLQLWLPSGAHLIQDRGLMSALPHLHSQPVLFVDEKQGSPFVNGGNICGVFAMKGAHRTRGKEYGWDSGSPLLFLSIPPKELMAQGHSHLDG